MTTTSDPPLTLGAWLRHDEIMRALDVVQPRSVLEFGIGRGAMGARLASHAQRYVGVEPDDESRQVAEEAIDSPGAVIKDSIEAIGDEVFDLVCAFEVLEHLEDDRNVLRDWREYLEPGGHLLFSVPAFPDRFGPSDVMAGHLRRYEPDDLSDLLSDSGFELISYAVTGAPLGFALEGARNLFAKRLLSKPDEAGVDAAERTAGSGRLFQPDGFGWLTRGLSAPFRRMQQRKSESGIGVVVFAVRIES